MIRLNKNESPYGVFTPEELANIVSAAELHRYPSTEHDRFLERYAELEGLGTEQLGLANGSDEWIQKLHILIPEGPMLVVEPDFVMYDEYARQFGRPIVKLRCEADYELSEAKILEAIQREKPRLFIFSQPNNPIGTLYSQAFVDAACDLMKELGGYCVVDEAYLQYSDPELRTRVTLDDHVIVLRTFSKIYGMAGLRIGLAISAPETMAWLKSIDHPYPVNSVSLAIGYAFLADEARQAQFFREHHALAARLKQILHEELAGLVPLKASQANYVLTYGPRAVSLGRYLTERGFVLRTYDSELLREVVRYSIGTNEEMEQLAVAIRQWKESNDDRTR